MLWGLIPSFSEEFKQHPKLKMDLTRVETFFEKSDSFRARLLKTSRCVIPANSYFEWERVGKQRLPYLIKFKESELMGLGGIYDIWQDFRETKYFSCSIITMPASKLLARIHPRMPFMLEKEQLNLWLDSSIQDFQYLRDHIKPYPDDGLQYYPVSTRVNKVENDDAEVLKPIKAHQNVQRDLFK